MRRRRAVLGSEMRVGKTACAITAADAVFQGYQRPDRKEYREQIWAVVPANVKYTFVGEIQKWSRYPDSIQIVENGKEGIDDSKIWIIMSYQMMVKKWKEYAPGGQLLPGEKPPLVAMLDEAHRAKNFSAKQTEATIGQTSLLRKTRATWLITGTPFPNNLIDCYALFNFCLYGKLGRYWEFAAKHCYIKEGYRGKKKVVGLNRENLPLLTEKVKNILHRDTLEAVQKYLPKRQDIIITIDHTVRSRELCDELEEHREEIAEAIENDEPFDPPNLSGIRKELAIEKIPQATEFVLDKLVDCKPIIVAGRHLELLNNLYSGLRTHCSSGIITGATNSKDRERIRVDFQARKIDCLILSIEAGGEGIDLSRADVMIICEEAWTPKDMAQVKARMVAVGKQRMLTYYYLMFPDSIDKRVHQQLLAKERNIKRFWNVLENRADDTGLAELRDMEDKEINWEY